MSGYGTGETVFFAFPGQPERTSYRGLGVMLVALPDGSTGVKADAQEVWIVPRSPGEVVPAGVREIDVHAPNGLVRVTDREKLGRIIRWLDALPTVQPEILNCPEMVYGPTLALSFRGAGAVLARARFPIDSPDGSLFSTECDAIEFSVRARRETPLVGRRFLLKVQRLLKTSLS